MQIILGPPGARLAEESVRLYVGGLESGPFAAGSWLLVESATAAPELTALLATQTGGMLAPGVKPLHQAADAVVGAAPEPITPLGPVARNRLIEEILLRGGFSGRFRLLQEARGSAGGLDYVAAAIRDFALANAEPDEVLDNAAALRNPRISELARAYQDYCRECTRRRLLDREGRLRHACELLESGRLPGGPPGLVAAVGLDRLSLLESRFLQAAFRGAERRVAAFTIDSPAAFETDHAASAIYAGPVQTVQRLRTLFPDSTTTWIESGLPATDARRHALDGMFRDPRDTIVPAAPATPGSIRVRGAKGLQDEADAAAHQAKRLLLSGAAADELVVATRSLGAWAPRLREAFAQAGVPVAIEGAKSFGETSLGRSVGLLLRLAAGNWAFEEVQSVVSSPRFAGLDSRLSGDERPLASRFGFATRRAAVEWIVGEQLLPKGRRALIDRVTWLATTEQESAPEPNTDQATPRPESPDRRRARLSAAATLAAPALQLLGDATQEFGQEAPPLAWHDRIAAALTLLDYRSYDPLTQADDVAALAALEDALASLAQLAELRGGEATALPLPEVQRLVQGWQSRLRLDQRWDSEGRVRLLTAETACQTGCGHLLLVGLDEQSFPRPDATIAIGVADDQQQLHHGNEMLLFAKLLAAPRESVTLSYAAVDEKAQTLNPSSFVAELERLFPPGSLRETSAPVAATAQDALQLRRQAVRRLMEGDAQPLAQFAGLPDAPAASLGAALIASHDRSHGEHFGPYEGVLGGSTAAEWAATRFGPEHLWSASQLEDYGECPFKFYMKHVLRAEPLESLALDVDYRRRGSLLHDAMVRFHRHVNDLLGVGSAPSTLDAEAFTAAFRAAVEEAFQTLATAQHEAVVAEIEMMQAAAWDQEYWRQHAAYDQKHNSFEEPLSPRHFEARFGPEVSAPDETPDPLSTQQPFTLEAGGLQILLTGQVDRIDVGRVAGQAVFSIIDYKTARSLTLKQEDIESGRLLQLVLYTIAVSDHLFAGQDIAPWRSGYWVVQNDGFKTGKLPQPGEQAGGQIVTAEDWQELVATVRQRVGEIVRDVRAARFPMFNTDEDCGGRCEFRTTCRVSQARSLGKTPIGEDA
ncbi:ATP-dependent helicase/deoxyribonuclease subunit B [Posidoniimonas polymericola]|uniref:ATP-dependent helicase/deoxyribonuclease subunit B n=1 Tax=Posidoniimonas polymericola TaxID=2528002 RepID=A0A5C5YQJ9_9BACT|nr:PD-(D/E)XK nuclease family protein [Posidoniimonas polymericola]TWT77030.1 ATP-dependent helicase/deoxyribonuclease subunit B [Posidoniimonas polymericola]